MHEPSRISATPALWGRAIGQGLIPQGSVQRHTPRVGWLSTGLLAAALVCAGPCSSVFARAQPEAQETASGQVVALSTLPEQSQQVYRRILAGGPFSYGKDGTMFGNRERLLPRRARGYYREYTVPTPGSRDRGARRIVCGGEILKSPETCFYTKDHYQSFQKIDPQR